MRLEPMRIKIFNLPRIFRNLHRRCLHRAFTIGFFTRKVVQELSIDWLVFLSLGVGGSRKKETSILIPKSIKNFGASRRKLFALLA
uniref:Uncharacterized protein n=1 Tax=Romanomermis culicivorax TaxID=13658 RepID=A0A915JR94_ROMCU